MMLKGQTSTPIPVSTCDLDSEYCTVEAFYSQIPSTTWRNAASQFFIDIRAALGIASLGNAFDFMYLLAHEVAGDALINIASPGIHDAVNVNNMAFQASRGFTGNGSSSYLNTTYAPAADSNNYAQNSASIGTYNRTNASGNYNDIGVQDSGITHRTQLLSELFGSAVGDINDQSSLPAVSNDSRSLFVVNRAGAASIAIYRAGVSLASGGNASTGLPTGNIYIGARNAGGVAGNFSVRQYAFAFAGRSMGATEQADFYTAVQTFMTAIGAQV